MRQSQVDKLYAGLKDLAGERRGKLEEVFKLYTLHREIDDLLEWIADKSVVAGSNEPGQDYEHVSVSSSFYHIIKRKFCVVYYVAIFKRVKWYFQYTFYQSQYL